MTLEEELGFSIKLTRENLAHRCRELSSRLSRLATKLESDKLHDHLTINSLGEIQSSGTIIDATCGRLSAMLTIYTKLTSYKEDSNLI
ncbi:MAG: hypothetical protein JSW11_00890 [Candidatus Heimdallarchaeota archaeon]|nr:MAG: hypothetical protein JSW11_00890 [Candidatus Heimdallarchaeota archaeon]